MGDAVLAWRSMDSAPKDMPILAFCSSECGDERCGCHTGQGTSLCLYHAHAEGLSAFGDGLCIVEWGGSWDDSTWEYPNGGWMPDWWFRVGSEFEEAANPTHWMPLPSAPASVGAHAERGDALAAPFMGDAVRASADAQTPAKSLNPGASS